MSIALYRRYRPQSFHEVIGQDHVVKPLMAALDGGRTAHAYLFSGPRGCGKTTSARILARCLNCVEYPTATPCGVCDSCRELSRDGSGSLDVVELDAASHGGVDDARDLREQAAFAPARDRFKIFIIDEAHMVTNQGFNALLKLVEEPPEHVKFIFATTEPEKVIGTIRSRTHHYPFRLVPPNELENYLAQLCDTEGVTAGKDVLSLVVRAGTGSVRDTLSVLDQIIGGSEGSVIDYERAVALLGYTSAALLDEALEAIIARNGSGLFAVVDSLVKSGHDPRRFVEDLLQRLRDLVIISLAGDSAKDVFVSVPEDQYGRMVLQANHLGAQRASYYADLTHRALADMVGATAPRLQLELLCARIIVGDPRGETGRASEGKTAAEFSNPSGEATGGPSAQTAQRLAQFVNAQRETSQNQRSEANGGSNAHNPAQLAPQKPGKGTDLESNPAAATGAPAPENSALSGMQSRKTTEHNRPDMAAASRKMSNTDPNHRPMPSMPPMAETDTSALAHPKGDTESRPVEVTNAATDTARPRQKPEEAQGQQDPHSRPSAVAVENENAQASAVQSGHEPEVEEPQDSPQEAPLDHVAQIAAQWRQICESPMLRPSVRGFLQNSTGPLSLADGALVLGFESEGLLRQLPSKAEAIAHVIAQHCGISVRITGHVGAPTERPAQPKPQPHTPGGSQSETPPRNGASPKVSAAQGAAVSSQGGNGRNFGASGKNSGSFDSAAADVREDGDVARGSFHEFGDMPARLPGDTADASRLPEVKIGGEAPSALTVGGDATAAQSASQAAAAPAAKGMSVDESITSYPVAVPENHEKSMGKLAQVSDSAVDDMPRSAGSSTPSGAARFEEDYSIDTFPDLPPVDLPADFVSAGAPSAVSNIRQQIDAIRPAQEIPVHDDASAYSSPLEEEPVFLDEEEEISDADPLIAHSDLAGVNVIMEKFGAVVIDERHEGGDGTS
ncbi:DNA polymerase III subunit gamma and tau [Trueperella sp. LYQ141]|uniref:DNA polymerase III subunit gamma and tau n=1 Tax=Trueperella sp. LYQ141 TaxID=3391058 RepID=UPI00398381C6